MEIAKRRDSDLSAAKVDQKSVKTSGGDDKDVFAARPWMANTRAR